MPHPGDHRSLGPLLDGDAFRTGDRSRSDRGGMVGDGAGESPGEIGVRGVEGEEHHDHRVKVLDVLGLGCLPASGVGLSLLGEALRRAFRFEIGANPLDGRRRGPDSLGEDLPATLFGHGEVIAGRLDASGEGGVAGRDHHPPLRDG